MRRQVRAVFLALLLMMGFTFLAGSRAFAAHTPYIKWCLVWAWNTPGGMQTAVDVAVADPDGSVPGTISSVTVSGPNNFYYRFVPGDYLPYWGEYWHGLRGLPKDGQYTFTVTNNYGNSATSHSYLTVGETIPLLDPATFQASGTNPLTPTLSWSTIPGYSGNLFYRARILDMAGNVLWNTGRTFNSTSVAVPAGVLTAGRSYQWQVDAADNYSGVTSNNSSFSTIVPLTIDNTRPFFSGVAVYAQHDATDTLSTALSLIKSDPSESVRSAVVTGPNGFQHAFDFDLECTSEPDSIMHTCRHDVTPPLADGLYTFTLTYGENSTVSSYFHFTSYDVALVDFVTMRSSGNPLTPVLHWNAPAGIDRPLYYNVSIKNPSHNNVWSSWTTNTSITVPEGILRSGVSYQWQVVANDSRYFDSSNRSISAWKVLTLDNSSPYFSYAVVYDRNEPGGYSTALTARVADPNGTVPWSIASFVVSGPGEFSYSFQPSDYQPENNQYFHKVSSDLEDGLYTFTLTDNETNSAITYRYHIHAGGTIPLPNEGSFQVSGPPLAPTISWSTVADYPYHLFYRLRIIDEQENVVYQSSSPYSPNSYHVVPPGNLVSGTAYLYRVEAMDAQYFSTFDIRADSGYLLLPTPPGKATQVAPTGPIETNQPTYIWNAVLNADYYLLAVTDSTGSWPVYIWYSKADLGCDNGTGTCSNPAHPS